MAKIEIECYVEAQKYDAINFRLVCMKFVGKILCIIEPSQVGPKY